MYSLNDRVARNTAEEINEQIASQTEASVARYAHARPYEIEQRLAELDREWDVERYLETVAPTLSLIGLALGMKVSKKFLIVPAVVQAFFLQHAVQGWCPPLPVLRRLGIRTQEEIAREKYALKALRGDFRQVPDDPASASRKNAATAAVGL